MARARTGIASMARALACSVFALAMVAPSPPAAADSVFYQPQNRDAQLPEAAWREIFTGLQNAGHEELVLQWTRYDDEQFGGRDGWLAGVVDGALTAGLRVRLGLHWQDAWFDSLESDSGAWDEQLNHWLQVSLEQAREWAEFSEHPGFSGWYLPLELPDRGLGQSARRHALQQQLRHLARALDAPLAASSYFTGFLPPAAYADWLDDLSDATGIEIWVQDGAGVIDLDAAERELYLERLDCDIGIIREAFVRTSADDEPFQARPRTPDAPDTAGCHRELVFSLRYLPEGSALPNDG